jgi:putative transposase
MSMAKKRKHATAEIAAKLAQADELATQGKLQSEIARTLGVSVMTLHRWRKLPSATQAVTAELIGSRRTDQTPEARIAELRLENSRLRRLVTDLLPAEDRYVLEFLADAHGVSTAGAARLRFQWLIVPPPLCRT